MSQNTKIEWADHTFNPWEGCQKVGPGCDNCYAEARNSRFNGGTPVNWGPGAPRRRTSAANWAQPLRWNANADKFHTQHGRRQRVFCASLADVFDNEVDPQWRADLFELVEQTPNLDWLLLTKRIGNALAMVQTGRWFPSHWPNVWLGATVVNQEEADRDISKLLAVPAAVRFLSIEPMLGPVDLSRWLEPAGLDTDLGLSNPGIDWVICGGESGPKARPMHPDWVRSLRDQCQAEGVPFFFKQWGEWWEVESDARDDDGNHIQLDPDDPEARDMWNADKPSATTLITIDGRLFTPDTLPDNTKGRLMTRLGKKAAGRQLDGREWNEVPS